MVELSSWPLQCLLGWGRVREVCIAYAAFIRAWSSQQNPHTYAGWRTHIIGTIIYPILFFGFFIFILFFGFLIFILFLFCFDFFNVRSPKSLAEQINSARTNNYYLRCGFSPFCKAQSQFAKYQNAWLNPLIILELRIM